MLLTSYTKRGSLGGAYAYGVASGHQGCCIIILYTYDYNIITVYINYTQIFFTCIVIIIVIITL